MKNARLALLVLWAGMVTLPAFAAEGFSADMVMQAGEQGMSGKVYATQDKMRYEMAQAITIMRMDLKKSYTIMPAQQMYMQQPIDSTALAKAGAVGQGELERVPLGKENVDGQSTEKFLVTYLDTKGRTKVFQWIDAQGVPVKLAAEDGTWNVSYKNVNVAPQPPELFEIPRGYQPMEIPSIPGMGDPGKNVTSTDDLMKQLEQITKAAAGGSADSEGSNR